MTEADRWSEAHEIFGLRRHDRDVGHAQLARGRPNERGVAGRLRGHDEQECLGLERQHADPAQEACFELLTDRKRLWEECGPRELVP
jgi:hypothetical protein